MKITANSFSTVATRLVHAIQAKFNLLAATLVVLALAVPGMTRAQEAYPVGYESTLVYQGVSVPAGVAVDTLGNVYIADYANNRILLETFVANGTYNQTTIGSGLLGPYGVAVDAAGNVFIADTGNGRVLEEKLVGGVYNQSVIMPTGNASIKNPTGIAVDAADNVYVTDPNTSYVVQFTAANGYASENTIDSSTIGSGVATNLPYGVAVDSNLNVFIADVVQGVIEVPWTNGAYGTSSLIGSNVTSAKGVAVDSQNNVYIANTGTAQIYEEVLQYNGAYAQQIISASGLTSVDSVAVDNRYNIYASVPDADKVVELSPFNGNYGNVNIGSTSPNITINFQFLQPGTLSQVLAVQKGNNNGEFAIVPGGTCIVNSSFNQGDSCSVIVNFKPQYAGTRYGAVELMNSYNELFGTAYIFGTGVGPQLVFLPGVTNQVASDNVAGNFPGGITMAVDGADNLFYTDWDDNYWHEATAASNYGTIYTNSGQIQVPSDVQTDGAGNVYVTDYNLGVVYKFYAMDGYQTYISMDTALNNPTGSAVDGNGNVYVTAGGAGAVYEIVASSDYTQILNVATGFNNPSDLGVDGGGDLFVLNFGGGNGSDFVSEIVAVNGTVPANPVINTVVSGLSNPQSIKVDNVGNLYIADWQNHAVEEWTVASGYATKIVLVSVGSPTDMAIDGQGNLFYNSGAGSTTGDIYEISEGTAPTLYFTGINNPQTVTILNIGNKPLTFPVLNTGNNPSISTGFTWDTSANTDCQLALYSLAIQAQCNFPVSYNSASGVSSGTLTLTDDTLYNQAPTYGQQIIPLNATGIATMTITADSYTIPFGQALPTYGYQLNGPLGSLMCSGQPTLSTTPANPTAIGTYTITITQGSLSCGSQYTSYNLVNGTLTISAQVQYLTLTTTNYGTSIPYGSPIPNLQSNYSLSGFVNGDTQASVCTGAPVISTLATSSSLPGTYQILGDVGSLACKGDSNVSYFIKVVNSGTLTITAISVTVTANPVNITYGATPTYSSTTVPSPLPPSCTGSIQYKLSGTPQNPIQVNTFTITPFGLNCGSGYKITYKTAKLTVSKDTPIVTITPTSLPHGASIGSLTYSAANSNNATDVTAGGKWTYTWNSTAELGSYVPNGAGTLCAVWTPKNINIPGTRDKYNAEYKSSASTCITVTEQPTIVYSPQPNSIPYGTGLIANQLGNAVTVTYSNTNITADGTSTFVYNGTTLGVGSILPGGTDSVCATWTPTPTYQGTYSTVTQCSNIIVNASNTYVQYTPTPSTITAGTGLVGTQLNAQAFIQNVNTNVTADGTFAYTWNGNPVGLGYVLPAGTQTICAAWTPSANYNADLQASSLCQTITVSPSVTITATPVAITYGATPGFSDTTNPSPLPGACTGTVTYAVTPNPAYTPDPVAGYTITPGGITCTGNYIVNIVTGALTVSQDAPTVGFSNAPIPYGTALSSVAVTAINSNNSSNVLPGGTLSYTWAGISEPATFIPPYGAGQLCVTWTPGASLIAGTSLSYSSQYKAATTCQNITVSMALLTITATPYATSVYESSLPNSSYTYVISGFVGNDGSGFLGNDGVSGATFGGSNVVCSGAPTLSTPVDGQTNPYPGVGIYTVNVYTPGFACTGYTFKINTGELHITPLTLTIKPVAVTLPYGSQVPTYQYLCYANGNLLGTNSCGSGGTSITGVPTITSTAAIRATNVRGVVVYTSNVGSYTMSAHWGSLKSTSGNYTFGFGTNTLTLTTSPQYLTLQPWNITVKQATCQSSGIPALTYKMTGFLVYDNQASTTTGTPSVTAPTYTGNCAKGTYAIDAAVGTQALDVYSGQTDYSGINYGVATLTID